MRDITIYKLDRKVFKEIPMECIKHWAVHKRPSILGISLRNTVDVTLRNVTNIAIMADDELMIYALVPPSSVAIIELNCNSFTSVEVR
nr:MAG TPA: hypothetical protein [Caudoviricetes sp.]